MHYLYILKSKQSSKYYVGETTHIERRLKQHIVGKTAFGKRNKDLEYIYSKELNNRNEARRLEYFIKRQKSSLFIERFIRGEISIPP